MCNLLIDIEFSSISVPNTLPNDISLKFHKSELTNNILKFLYLVYSNNTYVLSFYSIYLLYNYVSVWNIFVGDDILC